MIGCGAGVTAGAVSIDPMVKDQTIAEIEPLVPRVVSTHFAEHNFNVVANPKVKVHLDDARHYLLTTNEKFDAITSDPLDPWVKGAATLYTREFFQVVKSHLNPGGVVTLFVQLYESTDAAVKSEIATFLEAFPERRRVRQHGQRPGLRPRAVRSGRGRRRSTSTRCRRGSTIPANAADRAIAARDRDLLSHRSVRHLRGPQSDMKNWLSDAHHQHRPQSEAAVPGGPGTEPLSERRDLQGDDPRGEVPRRTVRRIRRDAQSAARQGGRVSRRNRFVLICQTGFESTPPFLV